MCKCLSVCVCIWCPLKQTASPVWREANPGETYTLKGDQTLGKMKALDEQQSGSGGGDGKVQD